MQHLTQVLLMILVLVMQLEVDGLIYIFNDKNGKKIELRYLICDYCNEIQKNGTWSCDWEQCYNPKCYNCLCDSCGNPPCGCNC